MAGAKKASDPSQKHEAETTAQRAPRKPFPADFIASPSETGLTPGLYIVATPIGNLGDITIRALETLKAVDAIACEDTRHTIMLLNRYGLHKPLLAYHDHNADQMRPEILQRLEAGQRIALVSDAGSPLISDPGYKLVRDCADRKIFVTTLPGASAAISALQLSGLPSDRFLFTGFLPAKAGTRRTALSDLAKISASLVIFESPRRLAELLHEAAEILGNRHGAVAREMTKIFEEVRRDTLQNLAAYYAEAEPPKGEAVVVIGPPLVKQASAADLDTALKEALLANPSVRGAADEVAALLDLPRREVYQRALALKDQKS